ncbi:helix-turn-helix domain-containing protein [Oceanicaulis sp.]|uniref:helix-turn-helix domain-containing protein n=1 Tax=Oceanicaulis sp. TaxID=1924941 RepID=UPI003BA9EB89
MSAETSDITDPRIARARAMREAGVETAEIARACGVGVSTIYRWAEAYGFRVCDLEAAAWAASGRGLGAPVSDSAEVPDARSASRDLHQDTAPHAEGGPGSSPGVQCGTEREETDAPDITPEQWRAMARGLKQRALRLTEAGHLRQAEQALRLAERYERMQSGAAPAPVDAEEDGARYYDELDARLDRLAAHLRQQAGLNPDEDFTPAQRAAMGVPPASPEDGGG